MFNRSVYFGGDSNSTTQNVKVNAVSGGIVKNHADSFFLRFHLTSDLAKMLLSPIPHRTIKTKYVENTYRGSEKVISPDQCVEVLQLVIVGDMEVVAEVIDLDNDEKKDSSNEQ